MVDLLIGFQVLVEVLDDGQDRFFVRFVAGERLEEERNAILVRGHPEDKPFEVPPAIFRMAIGDLDLAHIEVGLIRPGDAEVGGVDVDTVGTEVGRKKACCNDLVEELGWTVGSDCIERSAEHIVVEVVPCDALPEETFDGDIIKEIRKQVEPAFDEPETVEHHGFEHLGVAEMVVTGFGESSVDHAGDLQGVVSTGDNAEMADGEDRGVVETINERHIEGYSLKVQRSCGFGYSRRWDSYCG